MRARTCGGDICGWALARAPFSPLLHHRRALPQDLARLQHQVGPHCLEAQECQGLLGLAALGGQAVPVVHALLAVALALDPVLDLALDRAQAPALDRARVLVMVLALLVVPVRQGRQGDLHRPVGQGGFRPEHQGGLVVLEAQEVLAGRKFQVVLALVPALVLAVLVVLGMESRQWQRPCSQGRSPRPGARPISTAERRSCKFCREGASP